MRYFAVFSVFVCGCFSGPYNSATSENPDAGVRGAGWTLAKKLVTPYLKAPSTADFPWDTVGFTRLAPVADKSGQTARRWSVFGAVDAQNAFGAQLRSRWEVVVLNYGGQMFPLSASLDGKTIYVSSGVGNLVEVR